MARPILSHTQRARIAEAAKHKPQRAVARRFNVSQSTVAYCVALTATLASIPTLLHGTLPPLPKRGRTIKLHQSTLSALKELFDDKPWASNTEICNALAEGGTVISQNTLRKMRNTLG